ncbi:hypothetical protein JEQ12_007005 [Ovis aries]|uniref:Uncharacterized protein n=1 Tax=Ovis aries TaxID=9940 RepID=A0A835ZQV2_SHEEP|nr:hypothetical protein JEQ12_007005 [Ovis aries]
MATSWDHPKDSGGSGYRGKLRFKQEDEDLGPATAQDSAKRCAWQGFRSGGGGEEEAEERGAGRQVDTEGGGAVRRETSGKKDWSAATTTTSN